MSNTYPKDFHDNAIRLILEENKSNSEVSKKLGISRNTLNLWLKEYKLNKVTNIILSEKEELILAKKEIAKLKNQIEILKKAMAICNEK
ncbi:MAG: transposase [Cyanobacteriota bacterium]